MKTGHKAIVEEDRGRAGALRRRGSGAAITVAVFFCLVASAIIISGRYHSGYRLGEYVTQGVHARVDFSYSDKAKLAAAQQRARELEPRVYKRGAIFSWAQLEEQMRRWPEILAGRDTASLPETMRTSLDPAAIALLAQYQAPERKALYSQRLDTFFANIRKLVVLPAEQHDQEVARHTQWRAPSGFAVRVMDEAQAPAQLPLDRIFSLGQGAPLVSEVSRASAEAFRDDLAPQIAAYVLRTVQPTHVLDDNATQEAQDKASAMVLAREGEIEYKAGVLIKALGEVEDRDLGVLQAEHRAYRASLGLGVILRDTAGVLGAVAVLTSVLCWYILRYQPRIVGNRARAVAIVVLLIGMMLLGQLAASGTRPLYMLGIAPAILTAMILAIAYDPRFALGIAMLLATLTTLALNQDVVFLLIVLGGCTTACAFTGSVKTRGRLIEIGAMSAIVMLAITMFSGVWAITGAQPFSYVLSDALYAAMAGLASGFVVLGILPFVEKAFRITTGMTLLEISDSSHPLQRKMAMETPGTYSHVLQVAALSEAAAEAIGADALLTRVGALYHDIGKTKRPHYFCENQQSSDNAHLSLSPGVSFMIILEHLKDGMELAKQYNLPTSLHPFIQQHHGTTLVEFFYHEACKQQNGGAAIQESSFRYPGPKPRSREIAIVMLADACESATRALSHATPESVGKLVHSLMIKRLLDGQLSECELTMRELDIVEKTLARTLQSIHHSRVVYPDIKSLSGADAPAVQAVGR